MRVTPEQHLGDILRFGRDEAVRALGEARADRLRSLTWARYYALVPDAPNFQEKTNRKLFVLTLPLLALYQALRQGLEIEREDALRLAEDMLHASYRERMSPVRVAALNVTYQVAPIRRVYLQQVTRMSEPGGFRIEVPEASNAVLALDVHACPIARFAEEHGAPEIVPLICRLDDFLASKLSGLRLERTGTIGTGASHCDFRYVKKNQ
ncbi:L-2-amino-thiazoline-4-carboxylic acid hydrolase [Polyangium mundeleinium]|uniref:L-2-amino-thiazoline-4-carboxylic acid hydrolase n=1 Tax=Polyangium mundeleinium TaxID=2995306 RepID=A0ABT5EX20_9BACT|nr:L-2-amino-thiazoline-4-carboxylic acid hydrolase [Polyangium mundeleinium]MDC0746363.1 L-2-amino-thiazoline-4-carboxylic acid hydrolase [Polyangium mundeleinium]